MADQPSHNYAATSVFTDPITLLSIVMLALQTEDVRAIIPAKVMPYVAAAIAVGTIVLRIAQAVRPVAFIAPTEIKMVEVKALQPTQPGSDAPKG